MTSDLHAAPLTLNPDRPAGSGSHPDKPDTSSRPPFSQSGSDAGQAGGKSGSGGAWLWLPRGMEPKRPWWKRHPLLVWGGALCLLAAVFGWGRMVGENGGFLPGPKIAVVHVDGVIMDAGAVITWMEQIRLNKSYVGAVIHINSPGGAVGPSQEIYAAVKRLNANKPVAASMSSLAASGGYYVALGAEKIFAGPSTLTASIGVKMQVPNMAGLMNSIGISEKTLATGELKDAGSSWRTMRPDEEAYLRKLLDDMYEEFIATVAAERGLSPDEVRTVADGRAMTGRQALQAKLVDSLGGLHEAVQWVRERGGFAGQELPLVEGPERPASLLTDVFGALLATALQPARQMVEQPLFLY